MNVGMLNSQAIVVVHVLFQYLFNRFRNEFGMTAVGKLLERVIQHHFKHKFGDSVRKTYNSATFFILGTDKIKHFFKFLLPKIFRCRTT